jgi:hypothetical protein
MKAAGRARTVGCPDLAVTFEACLNSHTLPRAPGRQVLGRQPVAVAGAPSRVDRGSCPPRPPTDPDVRNSRIRLFGTWVRCEFSLAPFTGLRPAPLSAAVAWIRCRARCPRRISLPPFHVPVPPSLHRVRNGCVPLLRRYIEALRLPDDLPARLRFLRQRGTTATRRSLTEGVGRPSPSGLGWSPDAHRPLDVESSGSP